MDKAAFNHIVGERLREARRALGLRQEHAARVLGCSRAQVANIELGHSTVSVWQLVTLAAAYGRSVRYFCTPPPTPEQAALLDELAEVLT